MTESYASKRYVQSLSKSLGFPETKNNVDMMVFMQPVIIL